MTTNDVAAAIRHYDRASAMVPDNAEMVYWTGVILASEGRVEESLPRFERAFEADPGWPGQWNGGAGQLPFIEHAAERVRNGAESRIQ